MWRANHDARQAGFGHRRSTERLAAHATEAVEQAQAAIACIHADGAPVEQDLDQLHRRAVALRGHAEPVDGLDISDRGEIRQLDQILDATDTYTSWLEGRPTSTARLVLAVDTLSEVARHAPSFTSHPGQPHKSQWYELLELAPVHQLERGRPTPEIELGR